MPETIASPAETDISKAQIAGRRRDIAVILLCFLSVPFLFASNAVVARWNGSDIPPVALAFWRWALALGFLLPWAAATLWRQRAEIARDWRWLSIAGFLSLVLCGPPIYIAGQTTSALNISMIYCASPIVILLVERVVWGQRLRPRQIGGVLLCLAGVVIVLTKGAPAALAEIRFVPGDLWVVMGMLSWSAYSLIIRRRKSGLDLTSRLAAIVLFGLIALAPFYAWEIASGIATPFDLHSIGVYVFVAAAPGIGAFLGYNRLVSTIGPGAAGLTIYPVPVAAGLLSYLVVGEPPHAYHLVGILMLLPGMYLASARAKL